MGLTHKDVRQILDLLDRCGNLESIDVASGDVSISARRAGAAAPAATEATTAQADDAQAAADARPAMTEAPEGLHPVRAPMNGVFYARPSPEEPPFAVPGDAVSADQTVCLVEAMKLFNSVDAGAAGVVREVLVESGRPVERGQILILIEPAEAG